MSGVLSEKEYHEVFEVANNSQEEKLVFDALISYLESKYDITIKKCYYLYAKDKWADGEELIHNRVDVYIYYKKDFYKIREFESEYCISSEKEALQKLNEIVEFYGLSNHFHVNVEKLFLRLKIFEDEAIGHINEISFEKQREVFIPKYFNPETMERMYSHLCVIYKNKEFLKQAVESGETKRIADAYYEFIKPYDEYDILTRENTKVLFDSMESVEAHGGWFHYDRDIAF